MGFVFEKTSVIILGIIEKHKLKMPGLIIILNNVNKIRNIYIRCASLFKF